MPNQQLVSYIKQQIQMGESEAQVKSSLKAVGWTDSDIDEAMKAAAPAAAAATPFGGSSAKPATTTEPKKIDFGSFAATSPVASSAGIVSFSSPKAAVDPTFEAKASMVSASSSKKIAWIPILVMAVLLIGVGVLAGILFKNNTTLKAEVAELGNQIAALNGRVSTGSQGTSDLNKKMKALEEENKDLNSQLALFLPLAVTTSTINSSSTGTSTPIVVTTPQPITLSGTIASSTKGYTLTTSKGIEVSIKNSKDAKVDSALKPFIGNKIELTGTPTAGAREITVTKINGAAIQ